MICRKIPRLPLLLVLLLVASPLPGLAQEPVEGEVRQIVTFSFLPGRTPEAMEVYSTEAFPLYRENVEMLSVRAFREVESPVPLDLMVVSAFNGMAGMDLSNEALRVLAIESGTTVGRIYGRIAALSSEHTDQFVEMLPELGSGDPSASRLTAFVWYQTYPGSQRDLEGAFWSAAQRFHAPSSVGRFLISDGWDYLQVIGFESLDEYQAYRNAVDETAIGGVLRDLTVRRREVIVATVPALAVR